MAKRLIFVVKKVFFTGCLGGTTAVVNFSFSETTEKYDVLGFRG